MSNVEDIPEQYLWCRDVLHSWVPYDVKVLKSPVTGRREIHRVLRCQRCQVKKTQRLSTDGTLIGGGTSYNYHDAEGYLNIGGGRLTSKERGQLRKLSVDKFFKETE